MHAATIPECHFFQPLNTAVRLEDAAQAAKRFSLCLRPDAAQVSLTNPEAALVTCITPSTQNSGMHLQAVNICQTPVFASILRVVSQ
jgi:hypothetical protein